MAGASSTSAMSTSSFPPSLPPSLLPSPSFPSHPPHGKKGERVAEASGTAASTSRVYLGLGACELLEEYRCEKYEDVQIRQCLFALQALHLLINRSRDVPDMNVCPLPLVSVHSPCARSRERRGGLGAGSQQQVEEACLLDDFLRVGFSQMQQEGGGGGGGGRERSSYWDVAGKSVMGEECQGDRQRLEEDEKAMLAQLSRSAPVTKLRAGGGGASIASRVN